MGQRIEELEKLVKRKEIGKDKERGGSGEMENRLKKVEMLERKEKEKRKRNIVIKRVGVKEKSRREAVEEIIKAVGIEVEIEELRRIGEDKEKDEEMM